MFAIGIVAVALAIIVYTMCRTAKQYDEDLDK